MRQDVEKEEVKQEDQEDDNNNLEDGQEVYEEDKDYPDLQGLTAPVNWFMAQRFAEASVSDCKYLLSSLQQDTSCFQPDHNSLASNSNTFVHPGTRWPGYGN